MGEFWNRVKKRLSDIKINLKAEPPENGHKVVLNTTTIHDYKSKCAKIYGRYHDWNYMDMVITKFFDYYIIQSVINDRFMLAIH